MSLINHFPVTLLELVLHKRRFIPQKTDSATYMASLPAMHLYDEKLENI